MIMHNNSEGGEIIISNNCTDCSASRFVIAAAAVSGRPGGR